MASGQSGKIATPDGIVVGKRHASGFVTLARPAQLNAINDAMRTRIADAMRGWTRDPEVYALVIEATGSSVFSAGGDIRELALLAKDQPVTARASMAAEYRLNWALECFSKPTVALIDGLVVGSGVGLTQYGTHRVAGERYAFAMPEAAIGLFPDVGVASVLARLPNAIGIYLGLTGRRVGRADAYRLGLVTHCVSASSFTDIAERLASADPVDPLLDGLHTDPGSGELSELEPVIAEVFSGQDVAEIMRRLDTMRGGRSEVAVWAGAVHAELSQCAPMSLAVTLEHLRRVGEEDLRDTLSRDYRLACRFLAAADFVEGVRAMLVDKDRQPLRRPADLAAIAPTDVAAYFAPLDPGEELHLPSRAQMQDLRSGT